MLDLSLLVFWVLAILEYSARSWCMISGGEGTVRIPRSVVMHGTLGVGGRQLGTKKKTDRNRCGVPLFLGKWSNL